MKWFDGYRIRLMFVGFVAAIILGSGRAKADFTFGEPTNLGPSVNTSANDWAPCISADGLSFYFASARPGGYGGIAGGFDIWVTTRETTEDDWSTALNVGLPVNSAVDETQPCISADGLSLFFDSYSRPGGIGGTDLWVAIRATIDDSWSEPVNLGPTVNSSSNDNAPSISEDGLSLFFHSARAGGVDLWVTTRKTKHDPWQESMNLGPTVNSSSFDGTPDISADGLVLFFLSERPGGFGGRDLWVSTRRTTNEPWGTPINLGPTVNTSAIEFSPDISADGDTIYFVSDRPGGFGSWDLWQASIIPIVDLNGDGIVDAADMCIIVDHWGENYSLCDIGPMPWGDGVVDVQDLIILADHLFEEVFPIELVAYWKLDEVEGDIAYNSISDNHGILYGGPIWQPDAGQVAGALELDGIDDYASTDFVLNPADSRFSVFAWIKGGAPGHVIISQADGTGSGETWLGMDALGGNLMTGLVPPPVGRFITQPMESESVITDGQWHHIGFVWDGSYRILYVDGTEVARDTNPITLAPLKSANGGLYIGANKTLDAGTFFSGLIDDVRIYDKALSAEEIAALFR